MKAFEWKVTAEADEADYPVKSYNVKLTFSLDLFTPDMPDAAGKRMAHRLLKDLVADLQEGDIALLGEDEAALAITEEDPNANWNKPEDLDMRVVKSAHRVISEIAHRGQNGRPVLAAELIQDGLISAPTMSRLMRRGEPAGDYMSPYIQISPEGRTKALDLTPQGRVLASRIRAGIVPQ